MHPRCPGISPHEKSPQHTNTGKIKQASKQAIKQASNQATKQPSNQASNNMTAAKKGPVRLTGKMLILAKSNESWDKSAVADMYKGTRITQHVVDRANRNGREGNPNPYEEVNRIIVGAWRNWGRWECSHTTFHCKATFGKFWAKLNIDPPAQGDVLAMGKDFIIKLPGGFHTKELADGRVECGTLVVMSRRYARARACDRVVADTLWLVADCGNRFRYGGLCFGPCVSFDEVVRNVDTW